MEIRESHLTDINFHLIVESTPAAVLLVNQENRIAYVNRRCESMFGYTTQELVGQKVDILIPERFRARYDAFRAGFSQSPTLLEAGPDRGLMARRKDGGEFPVALGLSPLVLVDGTWLLASISDITIRLQAESRFRAVVQSAPNAMILVSGDGRIQLVNHQATELFGYTETELVGELVDLLVPDSVRPRHPGLRTAFFANPQTRHMGVGRDLVGRHKDGTEVPIEVGLNPIQTDEGTMVLASVIDITERKAQQELKAKKDAAEAAYRAKGELLAIASHDLKNPLASISGLAQIMLDLKKEEPGASQQDIEFLQSIHEAALHMSEVVKGILSTEGLEQSGISIAKETVDVSALVRELVKFNEPAAEKKGIHIATQVADGIAIHSDKTRLREAFDNYVSNAVKYSPSNTAVTVSLTSRADGQIEFGVRDQGPGLTEDDKRKMFGKFKRLSAKPTGGELSTGLGLSIVKQIVELHGGTVGCDSEPGHGAYFWARLPIR